MKAKVITMARFSELCEKEERREAEVNLIERIETDNGHYLIWGIREKGQKCYRAATRDKEHIHMGFNNNEAKAVTEFENKMKKFGECECGWGVTGRGFHQALAYEFAKKYPQYEWEIGYNYKCNARDPKFKREEEPEYIETEN